MKRAVIPVFAGVIAAAAACRSLAPRQRPIDEKPIRFVDARLDGSPIRGADLDDQESAMFNVAPQSSIDVRLAKDERARVRQFMLARGR